jgi:hypothetical protein
MTFFSRRKVKKLFKHKYICAAAAGTRASSATAATSVIHPQRQVSTAPLHAMVDRWGQMIRGTR